MEYITVGKENPSSIKIYYNDWGSGQTVVFRHGGLPSTDDWEE